MPAELQGGGLILGLRGCRRQEAAAIYAQIDHLPQRGVRKSHTSEVVVAEQMHCSYVLAHELA